MQIDFIRLNVFKCVQFWKLNIYIYTQYIFYRYKKNDKTWPAEQERSSSTPIFI